MSRLRSHLPTAREAKRQFVQPEFSAVSPRRSPVSSPVKRLMSSRSPQRSRTPRSNGTGNSREPNSSQVARVQRRASGCQPMESLSVRFGPRMCSGATPTQFVSWSRTSPRRHLSPGRSWGPDWWSSSIPLNLKATRRVTGRPLVRSRDLCAPRPGSLCNTRLLAGSLPSAFG